MTPELRVAIQAAAALAAVCWLLSVWTREVSWVDRLWSIAPPLYVAWFTLGADRLDPRLLSMTVLASLWGARLTYNFARKGGYRPGGEDYRWRELRRRMAPATFQLFNVAFICVFQNALLLLLALPAWVALERGPAPLGWLDGVATVLFAIFLAGETVADEQQWRFQSEKQRRLRRGEPLGREFITTGLFRYSRHPNFFCEQGLWWSFYLFGVAAGAGWLNPSILGPLLLTLLFQGSTAFTESISLAKYPAYADYRRTTPRLVPGRPRRSGRPSLSE